MTPLGVPLDDSEKRHLMSDLANRSYQIATANQRLVKPVSFGLSPLQS